MKINEKATHDEIREQFREFFVDVLGWNEQRACQTWNCLIRGVVAKRVRDLETQGVKTAALEN